MNNLNKDRSSKSWTCIGLKSPFKHFQYCISAVASMLHSQKNTCTWQPWHTSAHKNNMYCFAFRWSNRKVKSLSLCTEIKPPCSLHCLQFRSTLAMLRRCIQVSTGTRGTYRATFSFWWGQMSFFCIQPLRLAIKTTDIDSVHILFTDHKRSLWKCQV